MRIKNWVKLFLIDFMILDLFLITIYLYMMRIIEIGG